MPHEFELVTAYGQMWFFAIEEIVAPLAR